MKTAFLFVQYVLFARALAVEEASDDWVSVLKIEEVKQDDGNAAVVYAYSLQDDYKDMRLPSWVNSWDDIMFNTLGEKKYDVKVDPKLGKDAVAKLVVFSMASGYAVEKWHSAALKKRFVGVDLEAMVNTLWETGNMPQSSAGAAPEEIAEQAQSWSLAKRWIHTYADKFSWVYAAENTARVSALHALQDELHAKRGDVMSVKHPAICKTTDTWIGCLSWSGGLQQIHCGTAAHVIWTGIDGKAEDDWVSAKSFGSLIHKRWTGHFYQHTRHNACLSNRSSGCT